MARRTYTAKTKAKATGIAAVEGVTEAERQTGIPKETIHYWLNKPEFAQLRTTARAMVVEQFWVGIQVGLEQVVAGLRGDAPLNHKAEALKTLTDRFALLNGEATERTESRDWIESLDDHESDTLNEFFRTELGRRADSRAAGDAVATPVETGAETSAG